ncbi:hypothetical protein [Effusibacillus pohliae]|uniref:hypothetical protein n=1 Tax=Effusibacillus pohliae TaxID=232270 RepID=UPI00036A5EA8|nr:hypothetical protein [Effusibacillus pohliae]
MHKRTKLMIGGLAGILAMSGGIYYFLSSPSSDVATIIQPKTIQENGKTVKQFELTAEVVTAHAIWRRVSGFLSCSMSEDSSDDCRIMIRIVTTI